MVRKLVQLSMCIASVLLASCGGDDSSNDDASSTLAAPSITSQPSSVTVTAGQSASFVVTASSSSLSYQWYKSSSAISGATGASYSISSTATTDAGTYYVVVSNSAGSVTSNSVTLSVNSAGSSSGGPAIAGQPSSLNAIAGVDAMIRVIATGDSLAYQWYKDGAAISGATSATYTLSPVAAADAGLYTVSVSNDAGYVVSGTATLTVTSPSASCTTGSAAEKVVCAVAAFKATLTSAQLSEVQYSESSYSTAQLNVYKTLWSNLPGVTRAGLAFGELTTATQQAAFYAVAAAALSAAGYQDLYSVLAADDYLGTLQGGYGSSNAHMAFIGTPSTTGLWTLQIGNHHMAFNLTFNNGVLYPTPHHVGVEPKAAFAVNVSSYQALAAKAAAMIGIFYGNADSLSPTSSGSTLLTSAYLSGQTYSDVLIGPVEYKSGSYTSVSAKYPSANRGLLVSSLSAAQQAVVTKAIAEFVNDYDDATAAQLLADYTSTTAYANTYVAWAGSSGTSVPNVGQQGTYVRIDGPRVWIEIAVQGGAVLRQTTHYHMIFRDKTTDYYNELSTN